MKNALVVCGRMCSGKSAVVHFLSERFGFGIVSFGSLIRREVSKHGDQESRSALQNTGYQLFQSLGAKGLLNAALEFAQVAQLDRVVFDGVRDRSVLSEIRRVCDSVIVVYVEAEERIRHERYRARKKSDSATSFEEFRAINDHPIERGIDELAREADISLDTSELSPDVYDRIVEFLRVRGTIV